MRAEANAVSVVVESLALSRPGVEFWAKVTVNLAYNWCVNDDPQTDLLKHLATISTGASVVVAALRSELGSGVVVLSVALLFLSLLISVGCLAWKAFFYALIGEEGATHREIGFLSMIAYLAFIIGILVLVISLLL